MDKLFSCIGGGSELSPNNAQIAMGITPKVTDTTNGVEIECGFVPDRVYLYYFSSSSVGWSQIFDLGDGVNTTSIRKIMVNVNSSSSGSIGNVDAATTIVLKGKNGFIIKPSGTSNSVYNKTIHYLAVKYIDKSDDVEDERDKTIFDKGVIPAITDITNWTEVNLGFNPDLLVLRTHVSSTSGVTFVYDNSLSEDSGLYCGAHVTAGTSHNGSASNAVLKINNGFKIKPASTSSCWYNTPIYYYAVKYI